MQGGGLCKQGCVCTAYEHTHTRTHAQTNTNTHTPLVSKEISASSNQDHQRSHCGRVPRCPPHNPPSHCRSMLPMCVKTAARKRTKRNNHARRCTSLQRQQATPSPPRAIKTTTAAARQITLRRMNTCDAPKGWVLLQQALAGFKILVKVLWRAQKGWGLRERGEGKGTERGE